MFLRFLAFFCCMVALAAPAQAKTTVLMFGDSITAGYGVAEENALPAKLQAYFTAKGEDVAIINGGVSGDTTTGGRNRLAWMLDSAHPDLVFIALGGNDMLRGIRPDITRANLDAMLKLLKERKIQTILSSVRAPINYGPAYMTAFNSVFSDLADEYDVPLYPFLLEDTFGKSGLMQPDGIHPSEAGVDVIVEKLGPFLEDEIEKR